MFNTSEYLVSAIKVEQWPATTYPEICMAGRSNVGKSSFINALCNRKNLAYVGKTPGKTRLLNFYVVDEKYMLVDVPGYGFAALGGQKLLEFGRMMEEYFSERKTLRAMVQLVDIRHVPTNDDLNMIEFAKANKIRLVIVATKVDKISKNQRIKHLKIIADKLQVDRENIFIFSSLTKEGLEEIKERLTYIYTGE